MKKKKFETWFNTFRDSINGYKYYVDFAAVYENANKMKIEINILNSLVGDKNIKNSFENIIKRYPECINAIPLLLAVRKKEIYCQDLKGAIVYKFDSVQQTISEYSYFMEQTGLFDMLSNHIINNLFDYITGVEVGLGSNARKNRGGHQMEDLVESYLQEINVEYYKEMYLSEVENKWNVDLSSISAKGNTEKRWDFVVKTKTMVFVIETNFYASSGSKLNETARSYKMIATEVKNNKKVKFVWITDGKGWSNAKRNLKETFDILDTLYNIKDIENGALKALFKNNDK